MTSATGRAGGDPCGPSAPVLRRSPAGVSPSCAATRRRSRSRWPALCCWPWRLHGRRDARTRATFSRLAACRSCCCSAALLLSRRACCSSARLRRALSLGASYVTYRRHNAAAPVRFVVVVTSRSCRLRVRPVARRDRPRRAARRRVLVELARRLELQGAMPALPAAVARRVRREARWRRSVRRRLRGLARRATAASRSRSSTSPARASRRAPASLLLSGALGGLLGAPSPVTSWPPPTPTSSAGLGRGLRDGGAPDHRPGRPATTPSAPPATRRPRTSTPAAAAGACSRRDGPALGLLPASPTTRDDRASCAPATRCCSTPTASSRSPAATSTSASTSCSARRSGWCRAASPAAARCSSTGSPAGSSDDRGLVLIWRSAQLARDRRSVGSCGAALQGRTTSTYSPGPPAPAPSPAGARTPAGCRAAATPASTSRWHRSTTATFDAPLSTKNIDSPENTRPDSTPYRPPTRRVAVPDLDAVRAALVVQPW